MKKIISSKVFPYILLILIYCLLVLIVSPVGDFPLDDDWAHGKSVKILLEENRIRLMDWSPMSLVAQIVWGWFFCLPFGFSFTALRISTIVLSLIGVLYFHSILGLMGVRKKDAVLGCLLLIFNPLYFLLSYTFMTEVPFCVFSIISVYYYLCGIRRDKYIDFILGSLFASMALLIRQTGVVISVAVLLSCMIYRKVNFRKILILGIPVVVLIIFYQWLYNIHGVPLQYLKVQGDFISTVLTKWKEPHRFLVDTCIYLNYIGLFVVPLIGGLLMAYSEYKEILRYTLLRNLFIGIFLYFAIICIKNTPRFPSLLNIICNFGLGPILCYGGGRIEIGNIFFWKVITWVGVFSGVGIFFIFIIALFRGRLKELWIYNFIILGYFIYLLFTAVVFDRYLLFLTPWVIILVTYWLRNIKISYAIFSVLLIPLAIFSIMFTDDYLAWNRARWTGINRLLENGIPPEKIEGGFEYDMWHFNKFSAPSPRYYVNLEESVPGDQIIIDRIEINSFLSIKRRSYVYVKKVLD